MGSLQEESASKTVGNLLCVYAVMAKYGFDWVLDVCTGEAQEQLERPPRQPEVLNVHLTASAAYAVLELGLPREGQDNLSYIVVRYWNWSGSANVLSLPDPRTYILCSGFFQLALIPLFSPAFCCDVGP